MGSCVVIFQCSLTGMGVFVLLHSCVRSFLCVCSWLPLVVLYDGDEKHWYAGPYRSGA